MDGPRAVAQLLTDHLTAQVPAMLIRLGERLGPPDPDRPDLDAQPKVYASTTIEVDGVGVDDFPFVVTVVTALRSLQPQELLPDGGMVYRCVYPVRVFAWARGDGFHSTAAVRDRMVLALRTVLLQSKTAGDARFVIDEERWLERYSDIDDDKRLEATVGAAALEFEVAVSETLEPAVEAFPPVTEVGLDTRALPVHPALD